MKKKILASLGALVTGAAAFADGTTTTTTVPDIGVDMSSFITSAGTKLGIGLAAAIGVGIAIWAVKAIYRSFKSVAK